MSDERVGAGFKKTEAAGDDEQREEEERIASGHCSRIEQKCSSGVEDKASKKSSLISETAHDQSGGDSKQKVTKIKGGLHQARFKPADLEGLHELANENIIQVVGDGPEKEQSRHQEEGDLSLTWKQRCR